ncbi:HEAT repeat domain-containing protein [Candidatus Cyanaurora vandensis]|uniref:HEAT repeat domain-containing protein n=1 Tax=Candidatus Cyanaurora vandensis TaxID=2714958 RepID=UPI0025811474|nr:HEAT repeat domain-containing protein [Candidatus Cyanaurora vandensis]
MSSLEQLLPLLDHPDVETRRSTAQAIGDLGPGGISALVERLTFPSATLRTTSAKALAAIGRRYPGSLAAPEVLTALAQVLGDEDPVARISAVGALGTVGRGAVPYLLQALAGDDQVLRLTVASALGTIGGQEVIPALLELQKDADPSVAGIARGALAMVKGGGAYHHVA